MKSAVNHETETIEYDLSAGLSSEEAARRLEIYGENALKEEKRSLLMNIAGRFWGPIPWMIEAAGILSGIVRHWEDFTIIVILLVVNAGVSFWQEFKAENEIALLKKRLALRARVLRDGKWQEVEARVLVPGDLILVKMGNIVPADLKLISGEYLSVDESLLTGESLPVEKKEGESAYSGSMVKLGEMTGVVTATGMKTFFGKTAELAQSAQTVSHFQKAVIKIGDYLIGITVVLVAIMLGFAIFRHDPLMETIQFALILTVASIPVALPAVLSVTMAVGAEMLARMKAIVTHLVSIEELAGVTVLFSDKTGTLTQNRMTIGDPVLIQAASPEEVFLAAALASTQQGGDPIDEAIFARHGDGMQKLKNFQVIRYKPFDPGSKRTEAEVQGGAVRFTVTKGALQVVLALMKEKDHMSEDLDKKASELASKGYRVLAVGRKDDGHDWTLLGLLPMFDPPRPDSKETIERARLLGLSVKMLTGDHLAIARQIAGELSLGPHILLASALAPREGHKPDFASLADLDGFAQVLPEHKFAIVKAWQARDQIVAMTGDGVNDAPALKQADVGIAVSGATDAARAAADLVLTAPGLSVIINAIAESRKIFERMTGYAIYRIAETIRVLFFMTFSIILFSSYPVTAVMIVILALLNDFPIMMIAYDNVPTAPKPVRWDMRKVLVLASVLGGLGVVSSFLLFWIIKVPLALPGGEVQTLIFLKLLVAGHLTIYLTRNKGPIWQKPYPSLIFFLVVEATQVIGSLAAVYGWFMTPVGWMPVLAVWGYALIWFLINSPIKIAVMRKI